MTKPTTLIISSVFLGVLMLTACGQTGQALQDAASIDTGEIQNAGAGIRAAAKICSEASGKLSPALQDLYAAVRDKNLEAAQAAGVQLQAIADQLHQSETDGVAAAQGLSSLPQGAGAQATAGTEMGFKQCGATGDEAEGLATAISSASEADLNGKLQKEIDKVQDAAMDARSEIAGI